MKYFYFTTEPGGLVGIDTAESAEAVETTFFALNNTETEVNVTEISKKKYTKMLKALREHKDHAEYWEPGL